MLATLSKVVNGEDNRRGAGHEAVLPLNQQKDEIAVLGVAFLYVGSHDKEPGQPGQRLSILRELRVLGNYFHGHNLRINGHTWENQTIMSARELDCLKWVAAGKTAWEASVILGISERTVRFHLNAAREKLNSATTTQAVARAIANHMIEV
jgi:DNA-binding CsgD family transcriptional regulator